MITFIFHNRLGKPVCSCWWCSSGNGRNNSPKGVISCIQNSVCSLSHSDCIIWTLYSVVYSIHFVCSSDRSNTVHILCRLFWLFIWWLTRSMLLMVSTSNIYSIICVSVGASHLWLLCFCFYNLLFVFWLGFLYACYCSLDKQKQRLYPPVKWRTGFFWVLPQTIQLVQTLLAILVEDLLDFKVLGSRILLQMAQSHLAVQIWRVMKTTRGRGLKRMLMLLPWGHIPEVICDLTSVYKFFLCTNY